MTINPNLTQKIIKSPNSELIGDGTGILIIDDLVDTGKTIEAVRSLMPKGHVATVYAKPMGRDQVQTFITEVSQDTWIFFSMGHGTSVC